jgi:hypothetical protein
MAEAVNENINLFFQDPLDEQESQKEFGVLYLLRRDVDFCLGINRRSKKTTEVQGVAIWPGAITIMAGIDLLSKFYEGHDEGNVGSRFCRFLTRFFALDE